MPKTRTGGGIGVQVLCDAQFSFTWDYPVTGVPITHSSSPFNSLTQQCLLSSSIRCGLPNPLLLFQFLLQLRKIFLNEIAPVFLYFLLYLFQVFALV